MILGNYAIFQGCPGLYREPEYELAQLHSRNGYLKGYWVVSTLDEDMNEDELAEEEQIIKSRWNNKEERDKSHKHAQYSHPSE